MKELKQLEQSFTTVKTYSRQPRKTLQMVQSYRFGPQATTKRNDWGMFTFILKFNDHIPLNISPLIRTFQYILIQSLTFRNYKRSNTL